MNEEINEIPSLFGPTNNISLHRWIVTFFNQFWTDACLVGFYFFIIISLFVCVCVLEGGGGAERKGEKILS